jgi:transposase
MGASGAHASQDIADICGVSRATFFEWAKSFREGGFDALLEREKPGPKGMKLRGVLRVPRPRHPENDPEAADKLKQELGAKLEALPVAQGSRVRVWISKGVRPEVRRQTRYEWDYLYGTLEVVEERAEFLQLPTVNLECNQLFLEHLRSATRKRIML